MSVAVSTGTVLSGSSSGGVCEERPDNCVFFDTESAELCSHTFDVNETTGPTQAMAFDLPADDVVYLQQVYGDGEGSFFQDVLVNGTKVRLDAENNRVLIPFAGRFRWRYEGTLGQATVVCEPTDCCLAPLFPQQDSGSIQVNDAFGVNLFKGEPNA